MSRSVNQVIIVGNLTRDPQMRYTPGGHAVTSFAVATNRNWVSEGVEREEVEFHSVVAWNKLAELCSQFLSKGRKVYVQGRLQTRHWDDAAGVRKYRTEIIAEDMVILDSRKDREPGSASVEPETEEKTEEGKEVAPPPPVEASGEEVVNEEEIPF